MNIIEVNALKRTGHHAFINWLIFNITNSHQNNLSKYTYNHIEGHKNILWINEGEIGMINNHIPYIEKYQKSIDTLIISYEGITSETKHNPLYSILQHKNINILNFTKHTQITFIREFYNNMTSLTKASELDWFQKLSWDFMNNKVYGEAIYKIYKEQLKDYLEGDKGVLYDKWISDEEYANDICLKILGKPNKYNPLETKGTSSSFNDKKIDVDSLLNRYKTGTMPTWFVKKLMGDIEFLTMLNQALSR